MVQSWALSSHTSSSAVRGKTAVSFVSSSRGKAGNGLRFARILFFVLAFAILFSGFTFMRTFASEDRVQPASGSETIIYADSGDTLWTLASSMKKKSMDIREAVHLLMKRNDLHQSSLQNGQMLIVPNEILP